MSLLPEVAIALSTLAFLFSLAAISKASERYINHKLTRRTSQLRTELLVMTEELEGLRRQMKRFIARENMAKARAAKNGANNGPSDDDEWLKSINKQLNMRGLT